eukprot:CAMPEP_0198212202 /NCGR_PEP_ID=MMETSP1445-20131203/25578_1 /TAXON_ID=36898 /ORGANISM="Pyramimonas sp., Strain CCMP2087" /LENGTH=440 /DNA_ID=CAMNT_0043886599 /DNA_START=363 /DNA_END=1685 /DNA_ORIENTATION=+
MADANGGVKYTSHTQEKFHFPDGRRGVRFYVVEEGGKATPAVLGEERETCDGHYVYRKEALFSDGEVISCFNLAGVHRWLRDLMSGQPSSHTSENKSHFSSEHTRSGHNPPQHKARGRPPNDPSGRTKEELSMVSKALTAHQAIAERKSLKRAECRNSALAYVREVPLEEPKNEVLRCCEPLAECVKMQKEDGACSASVFNESLEALRHLQTLYINLPLLEATNIGETVDALSRGPDEFLAQVANTLTRQWLGTILVSVKVLSEEPEPLPASLANMFRVAAHSGAGSGAGEKQTARLGSHDKEEENALPDGSGMGSPRAGGNGIRGDPNDSKPGLSNLSKNKSKVGRQGSEGTGDMSINFSKTRSGKAKEEESAKTHPHKRASSPAPFPPPASKKKKSDQPNKTPLGKGRKLCHVCGTIVGSPTRVCPHCLANLPFKTQS